jgi:murein DD-endopeptidase MepM/ murein hydrolase activator NlpD
VHINPYRGDKMYDDRNKRAERQDVYYQGNIQERQYRNQPEGDKRYYDNRYSNADYERAMYEKYRQQDRERGESEYWKNREIYDNRHPAADSNNYPNYNNQGFDSDYYDYSNYAYNQDKHNEDYYNDENEDEKKRGIKGMQFLFSIQIIACLAVVLGVYALSSVGGTIYDNFKSWYKEEINKSIVVGESGEEYQAAFNYINNLIKDKINNSPSSEPEQNQSEANSTKSLANGEVKVTSFLSKPLEAGKISSPFSDGRQHKGIDIAAKTDTQISAVLPGVVEEAKESPSYGKYVIINHGNDVKTLYAHCNALDVEKGQEVSRGTPIAKVGSTGDSTGPHLHFEFIVNDVRYNPLPIIQGEYT